MLAQPPALPHPPPPPALEPKRILLKSKNTSNSSKTKSRLSNPLPASFQPASCFPGCSASPALHLSYQPLVHPSGPHSKPARPQDIHASNSIHLEPASFAVLVPFPTFCSVCMFSHSVMSDSLRPLNYGLPGSCPWDCPGKSTEGGCSFLLQGIFPTQDQTHVSCESCIAGGLFTP